MDSERGDRVGGPAPGPAAAGVLGGEPDADSTWKGLQRGELRRGAIGCGPRSGSVGEDVEPLPCPPGSPARRRGLRQANLSQDGAVATLRRAALGAGRDKPVVVGRVCPRPLTVAVA